MYDNVILHNMYTVVSRSPGQKGIGRLLVIIMEGVDLLASDANGKLFSSCGVVVEG